MQENNYCLKTYKSTFMSKNQFLSSAELFQKVFIFIYCSAV